MAKFYRFLIWILCCVYACSGDQVENPQKPQEKTEFQLSSKIIGKWNVDHSSENSQGVFSRQDSGSGCYVFSIVFEPDNTFIINLRQGTIIGVYEVISEEEIILKNQGTIGEVNFVGGGVSFYISLDDICAESLNCFYDPDYSAGDCSSFLECHDLGLWKNEEGGSVSVVKFFNHHDGTWYRKFSFSRSQNCYVVQSNQLEEGTMVLIKNSINELSYIYDLNDGTTAINSYRVTNDGNLELKVQNDLGESTQTYFPTTQEFLENNLARPECGSKTYVPDDGFEQFLIDAGYDHDLDDYVLTENIYEVTTLQMEDYYYDHFDNLTGIEDFTSLEYFTLIGHHSGNLNKLDFSGNKNLKVLYLEIPALEDINLSQNQLLDYVFLQDAKLKTIDFSNNSLLRSFEFNGGKLEKIDLSENRNLEGFQINDNPLAQIILGNNDKLEEVRIYGHSGYPGDHPKIRLSTIDVTNLPNLSLLHITNSNLEEIDLSNNSELFELTLSDNNLGSLDISNNEKLEEFNVTYNSNLVCIQIGEALLDQISNFPLSWQKDETAEFSLDCHY